MKSNEKKNSDYAWAKAQSLCSEVNLEGEDAKLPTAILAKMYQDPRATSQIDAVPGYEDRLVAALMAKAQKEMIPQENTSPRRDEHAVLTAWIRMTSKLIPATVFAFILVIGLAVVRYTVTSPQGKLPEKEDLWAKAVENAPHGEVSRWMAAVSDQGTQTWDTSSDIELLGSTLNEVQLERVLKEEGGS